METAAPPNHLPGVDAVTEREKSKVERWIETWPIWEQDAAETLLRDAVDRDAPAAPTEPTTEVVG